MKEYLFNYVGGEEPATEAEEEKLMKEWREWLGSLGDAVVHPGSPLSTTAARQVGKDGKVADVPEAALANGYSIIQAESLDDAVKMAQSCPGLPLGIKVFVFESI